MLNFALAFLLGLITLQFFSSLPPKEVLFLLLVAAGILYKKSKPYRSFLTSYLLGFAFGLWFAGSLASFSLPPAWEGRPVLVKGQIASLPQAKEDRVSFLFKVSNIQNEAVATLFYLTWSHPTLALQVGDEWQLPLSLKRIHGNLNPGGFDYEAWAFQKGISARGKVLQKEKPQFLAHAKYTYLLSRLRQQLQAKLKTYLTPSETSAWLSALMIGERANIPQEQWDILRKTGTNHLMAIAGLHIGFLAGFSFFMVNWLWRRSSTLLHFAPAQLAASSASLIFAWFYSGLSGFALPTQRASLMISIYLLAKLYRRNLKPRQAFSIALILVLMLNPLSLLESSFWLSFSTIALIIYGMGGRIKERGLWWKWGRPQGVIALGLLPLSIWIFKQYSLVSFIANTLAIPWVGFFILPFCFIAIFFLLCYPPAAVFFLDAADKSLSLLWFILTVLADFPWATWEPFVPQYPYLLCAVVGVIILLAPTGFRGKYLGIFWLLPLLLCKPQSPAWGEAKFTLLDVGQGLSAVVQTKQHSLVYDTGVRFNAEEDMGSSVILPFLRAEGISKLDMLVISHGDNDHSGGAASLFKQIPIFALRTSVPELFPTWYNKDLAYCLRGSSWDWDGVNFSFLNPAPEQLNTGNNSSCVLKITAGKSRLLLPGDLEQEGEKNLLRSVKATLAADIIVAPHHGSNTSALEEFIARVHPKVVLYALGYRNRYHFPHPIVVERYKTFGVDQYDTVTSGAIQFTLGQTAISSPLLYRKKYRHYWNA